MSVKVLLVCLILAPTLLAQDQEAEASRIGHALELQVGGNFYTDMAIIVRPTNQGVGFPLAITYHLSPVKNWDLLIGARYVPSVSIFNASTYVMPWMGFLGARYCSPVSDLISDYVLMRVLAGLVAVDRIRTAGLGIEMEVGVLFHLADHWALSTGVLGGAVAAFATNSRPATRLNSFSLGLMFGGQYAF